MSGIYFHIPFCKQACSYCDFYFVTRNELRPHFVQRLCEEIEWLKDSPFVSETVRTIYFGGGTPSLLSPGELEGIFSKLERTFRLEPEEITMELNPDDVTPEYLSAIRRVGVDRASVGIQSFDEGRLRFMNRAHTTEEALRALEWIAGAGFRTFSADLIYGSPGQTTDQLEEDVETLLAFDPPHLSAYALTIEPRTRLGKQKELGRVRPATEESVTAQFERLAQLLRESGIHRYEVSNYSRPGMEALHNRRYWSHENYIGLGPAAHSFWWDKDGARRWECGRDLRTFLDSGAGAFCEAPEKLNLIELAEERIMLGLRTVEGVRSDELGERYGYRFGERQLEWIEQKSREGLLRYDGEKLRLTSSGLAITDYLVAGLIGRR